LQFALLINKLGYNSKDCNRIRRRPQIVANIYLRSSLFERGFDSRLF